MAIIEFDVHIDNVESISAIYDRIQVWRSPTESGTYVDLTDDDATAAIIDGTVEGPWILDGLTLIIALNAAEQRTVTFSGTNPLSLATVLEQINDEFPALALEVPTDTDKVRLLSSTTGTQSILEITGTARAVLGLSALRTNGKTARLIISSNTDEYLFRDFDGTNGYWYKTRYYNTVTGAISSFSPAMQEGDGIGLPSSHTVVGSIALADLTGAPIVGKRIIFVSTGSQVRADGSGNNYGIFGSVFRVEAITDLNGRAEVTLVIGQQLKVFFEGTDFHRQFEVPNEDFDILEVVTNQPDPLNIVTTPPIPIRMS